MRRYSKYVFSLERHDMIIFVSSGLE